MPPSWAIDSTINTPGKVGLPGKCPRKNSSSPVRRQEPLALVAGTRRLTSSTRRNGGRCGRISAGCGSASTPGGYMPEENEVRTGWLETRQTGWLA